MLCEELRYNGQRRRDVPDLASGTLYIDIGDRAARRKRHSFHHELWHMVDFHLLGNAFEEADSEWNMHNPVGFKYGHERAEKGWKEKPKNAKRKQGVIPSGSRRALVSWRQKSSACACLSRRCKNSATWLFS